MQDFISEDDLKTFEGWLRYQGFDAAKLTPEDLASWRAAFDETQELKAAAGPRVAVMKLRPLMPGEYRYAVAVREGAGLWLTLWVRRSPTSGVYVIRPSRDPESDLHTSYHVNGKRHMKSHGAKVFDSEQRQQLNGAFRGSEELGAYFGHAPKSVGAICDPAAFTGVVEVPPGVLGPLDGGVSLALVEPGYDRKEVTITRVVSQQVFRHDVPWLVITVGSN